MKLIDLEPEFLKRVDDKHWHRVRDIDQADGLLFICPKCFDANDRKRPGVHSIICWDPSVPQTTSPTPGRWALVGTCFEDLSLVGVTSSSIFLTGPGCAAHFFIENGKVRMC